MASVFLWFCENVVEQVHLSMVKRRNKHVLSISKRSYVVGRRNVFLVTLSRYFSHVTKSRMFKNLNLRKKADRNFRCTFLKNRFRHLKLYSNPPSWLARSRCHMGTFWKTLKKIEVHIFERDNLSGFGTWNLTAKEDKGINKNRYFFLILELGPLRNQIFRLFVMENRLNKEILLCET